MKLLKKNQYHIKHWGKKYEATMIIWLTYDLEHEIVITQLKKHTKKGYELNNQMSNDNLKK
jgi:hypothetical protein